MNESVYDLVIIGGGPAGLTAGIYAARARINTLLLEKMSPGGQVMTTDWVENYPGFPEGISGFDLSTKFAEQAARFDLKTESGEVDGVDFTGPVKKIRFNGKTVGAHTVIIASGSSPRRLNVPGEDVFYGKGVSFCGTCDGPFYKDRVVAAIGGGDTAVQESIFLTKFARKVYLIHRRDQLRATRILQERALANSKIEIIWDTVVADIKGGLSLVEQIGLKNLKTGETRGLRVDGVFIWIGTVPNTGFLGNTLEKDEYGFIKADKHMETSVKGVYAAGDVRDTPLRQIVVACGDAAIAAVSAEHYLENIKK